MNCKKSGNIPEWLITELMNHGLSRTQATSQTAEIVVDTLNTPENVELVTYTKDKCDAMIRDAQSQLAEMRATHKRLSDDVGKISDTILAIKSTSEEWGEISDQKAKDVISLYATLLEISKKYGETDITGASYMIWAYLGGQAARNIFPFDAEERKTVKQPVARRREAKNGNEPDVCLF